MLDLRYVLEHLDEVRTALARRGSNAAAALGRIEQLGEERKRTIRELEAMLRERNAESEAMAKIADKKSPEFAQKREALRALGDRGKELEALQKKAQAEVEEVLLSVPNLPFEQIPDGSSEADNRVVRVVGDKPSFSFAPKDHVDVATGLGIMDAERGSKLAGARFTVLSGAGSQLQRALMMFMLDLHTREHGYTEVWPPALVNADSLRGTGQLPKFEADLFRIASDLPEGEGVRLYLSPTSEVQLTNMHRDEILEAARLPVRYTAYTPCFRSEAGSAGRDTRGLIRQHQFDKVELVQFVEPEQGLAALEELTGHAEAVLQKLELHYRVVELCAGDLGANPRRTYDLEVWLPGQDTYREISSCSWFGDFQARRAKVRYRKGLAKTDKPELVHTLNGSGLAIGRTFVALIEQHQHVDGSVKVPAALRPYMGGLDFIKNVIKP